MASSVAAVGSGGAPVPVYRSQGLSSSALRGSRLVRQVEVQWPAVIGSASLLGKAVLQWRALCLLRVSRL